MKSGAAGTRTSRLGNRMKPHESKLKFGVGVGVGVGAGVGGKGELIKWGPSDLRKLGPSLGRPRLGLF